MGSVGIAGVVFLALGILFTIVYGVMFATESVESPWGFIGTGLMVLVGMFLLAYDRNGTVKRYVGLAGTRLRSMRHRGRGNGNAYGGLPEGPPEGVEYD